MNNVKTNFFRGYVATVLILLSVFARGESAETIAAQPDPQLNAHLDRLQTFDGQPLVLEKDKLTHIIFQEIWSSYEGLGEEARVAALPLDYRQISQQLWVQPEINITEAQLQEYQGYYPQVKPLVLDRGFRLMRSLGGWDLPLHVILKDGKKVFSGSGTELTAFANEHFSSKATVSQWLASGVDNLPGKSLEKAVKEAVENAVEKELPVSASFTAAGKSRYHRPVAGEKAPAFTAETMGGKKVSLPGLIYNKPLSIVFVDSLCPMPHFPGCEAKLEQLNQLVANDSSRQWLGVVNSYYVNKDVAQQFRDKFQLKLPLVFDVDNRIFQSFGVHASPYQIDISRSGDIRSRGPDIH